MHYSITRPKDRDYPREMSYNEPFYCAVCHTQLTEKHNGKGHWLSRFGFYTVVHYNCEDFLYKALWNSSDEDTFEEIKNKANLLRKIESAWFGLMEGR